MGLSTFSGPVRSLAGFRFGATGATITQTLRGSASLDFPSIAAAGQQSLTITVAGAAVGDTVSLGLPAAPPAGIVYNAFVSTANTVTVRATNVTAAPVDPAAATFTVLVLRSV